MKKKTFPRLNVLKFKDFTLKLQKKKLFFLRIEKIHDSLSQTK